MSLYIKCEFQTQFSICQDLLTPQVILLPLFLLLSLQTLPPLASSIYNTSKIWSSLKRKTILLFYTFIHLLMESMPFLLYQPCIHFPDKLPVTVWAMESLIICSQKRCCLHPTQAPMWWRPIFLSKKSLSDFGTNFSFLLPPSLLSVVVKFPPLLTLDVLQESFHFFSLFLLIFHFLILWRIMESLRPQPHKVSRMSLWALHRCFSTTPCVFLHK